MPFALFSDRPGGSNDPFVINEYDADDLWTVTITDADGDGSGNTDPDFFIDGDTSETDTSEDQNQLATITDSSGNVLYSDEPIYIEWKATYTNGGHSLEMWRLELDNPSPQVRLFAVTSMPTPNVVYTTNNKDQAEDDVDAGTFENDVVCFTRGCAIETPNGPVHIEMLKVGDMVSTLPGDRTVAWVGSRKIPAIGLAKNEKLYPVRISAGALGEDLPRRDMLVSRQHRMMISSKIAERMFGQTNVLVAAIRLTDLPGIFVDTSVHEVEYFHLLFEGHEVVFAEGAPSESLYLGEGSLRALHPEGLAEVLALFPDIQKTAQREKKAVAIPPVAQQRKLIERHVRNKKPPLELFS